MTFWTLAAAAAVFTHALACAAYRRFGEGPGELDSPTVRRLVALRPPPGPRYGAAAGWFLVLALVLLILWWWL